MRAAHFVSIELVLEATPAAHLARLTSEAPHLALDLADHVLDADEVGFGAFELPLRLTTTLLVAHDARRLLEEEAPRVVLVREHLIDLLTLDHGVAGGAEAGAAEEVLDVLQPARHAVDAELALARTENSPRDLDLRVLGRQCAVVVVEVERNLRHPHRLVEAAPLKDHVLDLLAAKMPRVLLAENPAERVRDVALAAAVRTDDGGDAARERHLGPVHERLEAVEFEAIDVQRTPP